MKTARYFGILAVSLVMIFFAGCASVPEKTAIKNAASIDFEIDSDILPEEYAFLSYKENINVISTDGKQDEHRVFLLLVIIGC